MFLEMTSYEGRSCYFNNRIHAISSVLSKLGFVLATNPEVFTYRNELKNENEITVKRLKYQNAMFPKQINILRSYDE